MKDLEADYGDLLFFTEVRWLSRGKSLERLFNLRKEVVEFLMEENASGCTELVSFLKDPEFLLDFGFLCDMTGFVNKLNLALQGKNKLIIDLVQNVKQFKQQLQVLKEQIQSFSNMPKTNEVLQEFRILNRKPQFLQILTTLTEMFESRFHDFEEIKNLISLYNFPLTCNILEQDVGLQEELNRMKYDLSLPLVPGIEFWEHIAEESYPKTKDGIYRLHSMFGSTYNCESAFSTLKNILTKPRTDGCLFRKSHVIQMLSL